MGITLEAYGNSETVSTTEWSMTTDTAGPDAAVDTGMFQAFIDLSALAAGDLYEFKVYETARAAGTQRLMMSARFAGAQSAALWPSPSFMLGVGWDMTLKKISGTDRTITWRISKAA